MLYAKCIHSTHYTYVDLNVFFSSWFCQKFEYWIFAERERENVFTPSLGDSGTFARRKKKHKQQQRNWYIEMG